ncbi:putative hydrolase of HD superfamily [Pseudomonas duriflava]|uniref:Putative hydrolase of HD superfamily n=1 Tax=Pseudomonas duriflava TaxID=459528 RepID=A0A562QE48_9PSED|nr:HD domain-containing protein [Pseudomonas duriflava]TWI55014.1 putative hydrolase of HD superfamily [Pseudomonas duriflava]
MELRELMGALRFLKDAERLKDVLRSAHTSTGRQESTAEHTWRLCLMAMVFEKHFDGIDFTKLLKISLIHDLGEAIHGDIPAVAQRPEQKKSEAEREDLLTLLTPLEPALQAEFVNLWDEYEEAASPEARLVKGLDKLETILQHNQGLNPPDFDYAFNLTYGQQYTAAHPLLSALRELLDEETERKAVAGGSH